MYLLGTLASFKSRISEYKQIWWIFIKNFKLVNNHIERGSENKYFPVYFPDQFITPNRHPTTIWKYFAFDKI